VVGARLDSLLEGEGWPVEERYRVPTSLEGASRLVQDLLLLVERWHFRGGLGDGSSDDATAVAAPLVGRVLLVLQRARSPASCEPTAWPLLPLDPGWFQAAGARPWRSVSRPLLLEPEFSLFAAILREQLHVILFRAVVESLASENGARLRAMHSAQQHIEERLDELHAGFRKQRQDAITAELLDIVAGFEALGQDS
jgi:F-type H+-transporting ATPase subunit gamma